MKNLLLTIVLSVGTVDKIEDNVVVVEILDKDQNIHLVEISSTSFPCEIKEQEKFYIIFQNGTLNIRCALAHIPAAKPTIGEKQNGNY